jgi:hypothetical protein
MRVRLRHEDIQEESEGQEVVGSESLRDLAKPARGQGGKAS